MSFLSVLKSIGHVFTQATAVAEPLEPLIGAIPLVGPIGVTILKAVIAAEGLITTAASGNVKKTVVTAIVNAQHPGFDQSKLNAIIDQIVAAMNALQTALAQIPAPAATVPVPTA